MSPDSDHDIVHHIEELTAAELALANRQLAEAGRTIEELRADVLALAKRVDAAREEADSFKSELGEAVQRAQRAEAETERLKGSMGDLEAHIDRLKQQLGRPGRLLVKKALGRGRHKSGNQ